MISTSTKILAGVILALLMALLTVSKLYRHAAEDRDKWKSKVEMVAHEFKDKETRFNERMEAYKYARDEVAKYYNEAVTTIENFKKDENETECEAADRFFDGVKY